MKKFFYFLLIALPILFVGCSDDDDKTDSLVGTQWEYTETDVVGGTTYLDKIVLSFKTENTCEAKVEYSRDGEIYHSSTNVLTYSYKAPIVSFISYENGEIDEEFDGTIKGNEMHFIFEDDEIQIFKKK